MSAQIVVTVMRDVVSDLPQRLGRVRGQETQATDDAIQIPRRRKTQVTSVVPDDEQARRRQRHQCAADGIECD